MKYITVRDSEDNPYTLTFTAKSVMELEHRGFDPNHYDTEPISMTILFVEGALKAKHPNITQDKAIEILVNETGIAKTMFFKSPEMISPSQCEDVITSKLMKEIVTKYPDLVYKPAGKPTLVPESDKRPAMGVSKANEDFKDFIKK